MTVAAIRPITIEEFLQLPETEPASEFINGKIIQKPMPQGEHSQLQIDLCETINQIAKPQKIAKAFPELRCVFGGLAIVPDITVFRWERIPRLPSGRIANRFEIYPDWAIEILSPDQNQTKVVKNILYCLDHGTQMGWLIDPEEEIIFVYFSDRTIAIFESENALLPVPAFATNFQITLGQLFDWLRG